MALTPRAGLLNTAKLEADGTFTAGDMGFIDSDGKVSVIGSANTGDIVIAAEDAVAGDEITFWTEGTFTAPSGNDSSSAQVAGEVVYAKAAGTFDAGSVGDIPAGVVIGPSASNADGATIHIRLRPGLPAKS